MEDETVKELMSSRDTAPLPANPSKGDEGATQLGEAVDPCAPGAAEDDQQKERVPIVWTGRSKDPPAAAASSTGNVADAVDGAAAQKPVQRLKPNTGFLLNLVADAERGNKRKCAEEATQVSLNVLGQAVAAGVRPQMERIGPDGTDAALRRVVLSVAQQQRLAVCSALLREVAASFGFALHVGPDIGDEDAEERENETAASGGGAGDDGGVAGPSNGVSKPQGDRLGLQSLRVQLNLASRKQAPEPNIAVSAPSSDDDMAQRAPKPRAPGINMTASRLAGAALGAIGVPVPDKQPVTSKLSPSQALHKLSAKGDGRASLFALDTLAHQEIEAGSGEEKDNELDELDDDLDADDMIDDDLEDEASAGQSAEFSQPLSSKAEAEPGSLLGSGVASRLTRLLGASRAPTQAGNGPPAAAASRLGQSAPRPNSSAHSRGPLRMDAPDAEATETKFKSSGDEAAPPGKRLRSGAGLQSDSAKRQRGSATPSRADSIAAAVAGQPRRAEPAVDMARLLSRASAAASAQKRQPAARGANGSAVGEILQPSSSRKGRSGVARDDEVRDGSVSDDGDHANGTEGAEQIGMKPGARRSKRGRGADALDANDTEGEFVGRGYSGRRQSRVQASEESESEDDMEEEAQRSTAGKSRTQASRGLFGAAMAGLQSRHSK